MCIELFEEGWKADVSRSHTSVSFQLLSAVLDCGRASETMLLSGCDLTDCLSEIGTHSDVDSVDIVDRNDNRATVQLTDRVSDAIDEPMRAMILDILAEEALTAAEIHDRLDGRGIDRTDGEHGSTPHQRVAGRRPRRRRPL